MQKARARGEERERGFFSTRGMGYFQGILLCYALWKPCSWSLFISFSYGQLHLLVTDLNSNPHWPCGLLKFGNRSISFLPGHTIIRPTSRICCIIVISVTVCVYPSFSMNIVWYVIGRITTKTAFLQMCKQRHISVLLFSLHI